MASKSKTKDVESLDESENFHFMSSEAGAKLYYVPVSIIRLSGFFTILHNNIKETEHKSHSVLTMLTKTYDGRTYKLNTNRLLGWIEKYLLMWKDNSENIDYVSEDSPIQVGNPALVLNKIDLEYLEDFITSSLETYPTFDQNKYNSSTTYKRAVKIYILSELLVQAEGFLDIDSLAKKIYVYIATLFWNCSIIDVAEAEKDPIYKRIQTQLSEERLLRTETTGDGHENDPDLEQLRASAELAEDE